MNRNYHRAPNKFNYERTKLDGYSFQSKLEAAVYSIIQNRVHTGDVRLIQCQDHVKLTQAEILYIPDFKCEDTRTGNYFWVEAKGFETREWRLKRRLWLHYGPGELEIWGGSHTRPILKETLRPWAIRS